MATMVAKKERGQWQEVANDGGGGKRVGGWGFNNPC